MFNGLNTQAQPAGLLAGLQVVGGRPGRARGTDLQKGPGAIRDPRTEHRAWLASPSWSAGLVGWCIICAHDHFTQKRGGQAADAGTTDQGLAVATAGSQRESAAFRSHRRCSQRGLRGADRKKAFRQVLTQRRLQGLSVARACRHFGISRQAYYKAGHRQQQQLVEGARAIALVGGYRARQPRIGTRKLHGLIRPALQASGIAMGRAA